MLVEVRDHCFHLLPLLSWRLRYTKVLVILVDFPVFFCKLCSFDSLHSATNIAFELLLAPTSTSLPQSSTNLLCSASLPTIFIVRRRSILRVFYRLICNTHFTCFFFFIYFWKCPSFFLLNLSIRICGYIMSIFHFSWCTLQTKVEKFC